MGVSVRRNFAPLTDRMLTDTALMREVGLLARERIQRRTLSGRDQHDQPFAPYSAGYAEAKQQALGSTGAVNLQVSGDMLNAIQIVDVTDHSVRLTFIR